MSSQQQGGELAPLTFMNIRHGRHSAAGIFRILDTIFGWKDNRKESSKSANKYTVDEVEDVEWFRASHRDYGLSVTIARSQRLDFVGFREADFEPLSAFIKKHWKKPITTIKLGCKGWHWGQWSIKNKRFCLESNGQRVFDIPCASLTNVSAIKSDIILELAPEPQAPISDDQPVEIRFCVAQPKEGESADIAESVKAELLDNSGLASAASDAILLLTYKQCHLPPGRYDVLYYNNMIKLHGKSSDFSIPFDNVSSMFLLPSPLGAWSCLVLQLSTPLRRGQTKYPSVIVQLDDKKEIDVELNVTTEELEKMQSRVPEIKQTMSSELDDSLLLSNEPSDIECEIAGLLLRSLSGKPLIGASDFRGSSEYPCFRCSHKVAEGFFYPLQKCFIFLHKPVIMVRFDEIASVNFGRIQGSQTRLFDFQLTLRNGNEQEFSGVDRQDLQASFKNKWDEHTLLSQTQPFMDFITAKGLRVRNLPTISREDRQDIEEDDEDEGEEEAGLIGEEESSDQDFEEGDEDEEASSGAEEEEDEE